MSNICINRTGAIIPVYTGWDGTGSKIGRLYPNERYTAIQEMNSSRNTEVWFRNSAGKFIYGIAYASTTSQGDTIKYCTWDKYDFGALATPSGIAYELHVDRAVKIYNTNGTYRTTIYAGDLVFCGPGAYSGDTHKDWIEIYAYEKAQVITNVRAFADTGIGLISSTNTPIYGNW